MVKITITQNEGNQRLDRFLRKYLKRAPLAMIYKLIRKDIKVNGKRGKEDTMLEEGDEVSIYLPEEKLAELTAPVKRKRARRTFGIVYEDDNVLVVNKPSGLLTHGDSHEKKNTLANQVLGYLQDNGEYDPAQEKTFSPAPANRLDRNTSGLVLFGKNAEALRELTSLMSNKEHVDKIYRAVVCGSLDGETRIDGRLVKDQERNLVRVDDAGKEALTYVESLEHGKRLSLVEIRIVTGRTHQIRVHLADIGHPVAGDAKYGKPAVNRKLFEKFGVSSQMLHAYEIKLGQIQGELGYLSGKEFRAPVPELFERIMEEYN